MIRSMVCTWQKSGNSGSGHSWNHRSNNVTYSPSICFINWFTLGRTQQQCCLSQCFLKWSLVSRPYTSCCQKFLRLLWVLFVGVVCVKMDALLSVCLPWMGNVSHVDFQGHREAKLKQWRYTTQRRPQWLWRCINFHFHSPHLTARIAIASNNLWT